MMIHSIKIFELFPSLDFGYTVTSSLFTMYICSSVTKEWHHKPATESKYNECKLVHIANGWVYMMNEESLVPCNNYTFSLQFFFVEKILKIQIFFNKSVDYYFFFKKSWFYSLRKNSFALLDYFRILANLLFTIQPWIN